MGSARGTKDRGISDRDLEVVAAMSGANLQGHRLVDST